MSDLPALRATVDVVFEIVGVGDTYLVRRKGGSFAPADFEWDDALDGQLKELDTSTPDRVKLAAIGRRLGRFFESGVSEPITSAAQGTTVRITCRLHAISNELNKLPWETTTFDGKGVWLGMRSNCLLRYETAGTTTEPRRPSHRSAGRILFAYSNAGDTVPVRAHREAIERGCAAGNIEFVKEEDEIGDATFDQVVARLEAADKDEGRGPFTILHLLCHGGAVDDEATAYGLIWKGGKGSTRGKTTLDPQWLAAQLEERAPTLRLVVLCVCKSGDIGARDNPMGSVAQQLHQARIEAVIGSRFPMTTLGSQVFAGALYDHLLGNASSLEEAFLRARNRLCRERPAEEVDYASVQLWTREEDGGDTRPVTFRPYRGLLTFQAEHRRFYFGRDTERVEVLRKLDSLAETGRPKFVVIEGTSGSGKSSLVMAGVLPALLDLGLPAAAWQSFTPGADPEGALRDARARLPDRGVGRRYLFVDQFEELFTHTATKSSERDAPAAKAEVERTHTATTEDSERDALATRAELERRSRFAAELWRLAGDAAEDIAVLCTLRSDFKGHLGELVADGGRLDQLFRPGKEFHHVFVAQMTPEGLLAAVTGPAKTVGLVFDPGLAERIVAEAGADPEALPLMELALDQLWQRRVGRTLAAEAYGTSGLADAVRSLTQHLFTPSASTAGLLADERVVARELLVRLVGLTEDGVPDRRLRLTTAELRSSGPVAPELFDSVVERLRNARVLVRRQRGTDYTLELAHEALIRTWPELKAWVIEDRQRLAEQRRIDGWVRDGELLTDNQLGYAQQFAERHPGKLSPEALRLVERTATAQQQKREQEQRQLEQENKRLVRLARQRVGIIVILIVATLSISALAVWAFDLSEDEKEQARRADTSAAEAREAAAKADAAAAHNLKLAVLYRVQRTNTGTRAAVLRELDHTVDPDLWHRIAFATLNEPIPTWIADVGLDFHSESLELTDSGGTLVLDGGPGLRVWDAQKGHLVHRVPSRELSDLAFSRDGTKILAAVDGKIRVLDVPSARRLAELDGKEGMLSGDAQRVLTMSSEQGGDRRLALWDLSGPRVVHDKQIAGAGALHGVSDDGMRVLLHVPNSSEFSLHALDEPGHVSFKAKEAIFVSNRRILAVSEDKARLLLIDPDSGKTSQTYPLSPQFDDRGVAMAALLTRAPAWAAVRELIPLLDQQYTAEFGSNGWQVLRPDSDPPALVWPRELGGRSKWLETILGTGVSEALLARGGEFVLVGADGPMNVIDAETGAVLARPSDTGVGATIAGQRAAMVSHDGFVSVWDRDRVRRQRVSPYRQVTSAAFSPGGTLYVGHGDGAVIVWSPETLRIEHERSFIGEIEFLSASPREGEILVGMTGRDTMLWTVGSEQLRPLPGTATSTRSRFNRDGQLALTDDESRGADLDSGDGQAVWSVDKQQRVRDWSRAALEFAQIEFNAAGTRAVVISDTQLRLHDATSGKVLGPPEPTSARFARFAPDGNWFLAWGEEHAVILDGLTGALRGRLEDSASVHDAAFSPDGAGLVTTDGGTATLWNISNDGRTIEVGRPFPHDDVVERAALSAGGRWLITRTTDSDLYIWNSASGELIARLDGFRDFVLDPGGTRLFALGPVPRYFPLETDTIRRYLWHATPHCLDVQHRVALLQRPLWIETAWAGVCRVHQALADFPK